MDIREIQTRMKALGLYEGPIGESDRSKAHDDAVMGLFRANRVAGWDHWPAARRTIAAGQLFCRIDGIDAGDIDGLMGPMTRHAFEVHAARQAAGGKADPKVESWRDDEGPAPEPAHAATNWPRQSGVSAFYGAVGTRQTRLIFPYPMRLAWATDQIVKSTSCHEKVKPAMERAFARTLDHYGIDGIRDLRLDLFGGCLNVRKMRGGSAWSMHSWGIAVDIDPERNQLKWGRDRASLARPEFEPWWSFWEDEGAVSLGRARNYDWMHVQFARL